MLRTHTIHTQTHTTHIYTYKHTHIYTQFGDNCKNKKQKLHSIRRTCFLWLQEANKDMDTCECQTPRSSSSSSSSSSNNNNNNNTATDECNNHHTVPTPTPTHIYTKKETRRVAFLLDTRFCIDGCATMKYRTHNIACKNNKAVSLWRKISVYAISFGRSPYVFPVTVFGGHNHLDFFKTPQALNNKDLFRNTAHTTLHVRITSGVAVTFPRCPIYHI